MKHHVLGLCLVFALGSARSATAQPAGGDAARTEARERFDRGLKLFEDGDNAGALAEFKRTQELLPNPFVLLNIGLVYAAMNRPVEAADALAKVLAEPGSLSQERLASARRTLEEQSKRIARLHITTSVDAVIEIDGIEAGKTPLAQPLRVAGGAHLVGALASGHLPSRKEVTVAGGAAAEVTFELRPTEAKIGRLEIRSRLPGVDVAIDGETVGRTPVLSAVSVPAGKHQVELRRRGYSTARREIDLREGATAELALEPEEDASAPASDMARLRLEVSEAEAEVHVDGRARGVYRAPLPLPAGPHRLRIERAGFEPLERDIDLPAGGEAGVRVTLNPTPETRAAYVGAARGRRRWGVIALATGAALAGGGVVVAKLASDDVTTAEKERDVVEANRIEKSGRECDPLGVTNAGECATKLERAYDHLNSARLRRTLGFAGAGVGIAALVVGTVLLVTADDPGKYDRPAKDTLAWRATGWVAPGGGGFVLGAVF